MVRLRVRMGTTGSNSTYWAWSADDHNLSLSGG
jgi:hypothetical protein